MINMPYGTMIYVHFKYIKNTKFYPPFMFNSGQFVSNAFQITPSLISISQFGHTGHKRSFTVLFKPILRQKIQYFHPHICIYVCSLQAQHSDKRIFEVFTLYIPNRLGKFQVVSEIQQFSETMSLGKIRDLSGFVVLLRHIWMISGENIFGKLLYL